MKSSAIEGSRDSVNEPRVMKSESLGECYPGMINLKSEDTSINNQQKSHHMMRIIYESEFKRS